MMPLDCWLPRRAPAPWRAGQGLECRLVVLHEGLLGEKLDMALHAHDEIVIECDDNPETIERSLKALVFCLKPKTLVHFGSH